MYGILVSALNFILGFVLRGIVFKFVIAFMLYWAVQLMAEVLIPMLPQVSSVSSALAAIPSGVWWFLDIFAVSQGLPLVISAHLTRFIIRRIPLIG